MELLKRIYRKIKRTFGSNKRYDQSGERVDITYTQDIVFDKLDMYQKSHIKRYEFATSRVTKEDACGDFACGTGYGTIMLAKKCKSAIGVDLNEEVIKGIKKRYQKVKNITFINENLLNLKLKKSLDVIVSFETIEHFEESQISLLLKIFNNALKINGRIILSTPYLQEKDKEAIELGHHQTFNINEETLLSWLNNSGFKILNFHYQNYQSHELETVLEQKDFIICEAVKIEEVNA